MPFVKTMTVEERLLSKREVTPAGCWNWTGAVKKRTAKKAYLPYASTTIGSRSDGSLRHVQVYRLAAYIWLGLDLSRSDIHILHKCDNPKCFNPDHLFFGNNLSNVFDACDKGRHYSPRGEQIPTAKLTPDLVVQIWSAAANTTEMRKDIAKRFGISYTTLKRIINGRLWSHV